MKQIDDVGRFGSERRGTMPDAGLSILLVEDEALIGFEAKLLLEQAGYRVIGPLPTVKAALSLLETTTPDLALLDVNLNGTRVTPVAELLQEKRVPYALLTGYTADFFEEPALRRAVLLRKPFEEGEVLSVLRGLSP